MALESQLRHTADTIAQKRRQMGGIQEEIDRQARKGGGGHGGVDVAACMHAVTLPPHVARTR